MKAVIMAGGFGTRIRPLTTSISKPMLPLLNRPLMLHTLELLKRHGIREVVVLLHHRAAQIQQFFGDGQGFGVQITYCTTATDLGTAGAARTARKYLDETFLLISGDILTDLDLCEAIAQHTNHGAAASMLLSRTETPCAFGVVDVDPRGRVTRFMEKPPPESVFSDKINTGIYVLEPQVLDLIPPGLACDWSRDVFPYMLRHDLPLYGLFSTGYWQDIGTPHAYRSACLDIYAGKIRLQHPTFPLGGTTLCNQTDRSQRHNGIVLLARSSRLDDSTCLSNVVIGRNCVIEPGCHLENTILWDHVHLRRDSRVSGTVLGNHVSTGPGVDIKNAIIADRARVTPQASVSRDMLAGMPPATLSCHGQHPVKPAAERLALSSPQLLHLDRLADPY